LTGTAFQQLVDRLVVELDNEEIDLTEPLTSTPL
jgi:hypothetical protein